MSIPVAFLLVAMGMHDTQEAGRRGRWATWPGGWGAAERGPGPQEGHGRWGQGSRSHRALAWPGGHESLQVSWARQDDNKWRDSPAAVRTPALGSVLLRVEKPLARAGLWPRRVSRTQGLSSRSGGHWARGWALTGWWGQDPGCWGPVRSGKRDAVSLSESTLAGSVSIVLDPNSCENESKHPALPVISSSPGARVTENPLPSLTFTEVPLTLGLSHLGCCGS